MDRVSFLAAVVNIQDYIHQKIGCGESVHPKADIASALEESCVIFDEKQRDELCRRYQSDLQENEKKIAYAEDQIKRFTSNLTLLKKNRLLSVRDSILQSLQFINKNMFSDENASPNSSLNTCLFKPVHSGDIKTNDAHDDNRSALAPLSIN